MLDIIDIGIISGINLFFLLILVRMYQLDQEAKFTRLKSEMDKSLSEFKSYGNSLRASLGRLANTSGSESEASPMQYLFALLSQNPSIQNIISRAVGGALNPNSEESEEG